MMHIDLQNEPGSFNAKVRQPGQTFLSRLSDQQKINWKGHDYWTRCINDMYSLYGGICAYTCLRIQKDSSYPTVDHFVPKKKQPNLAYDWANFRLATIRVNAIKGDCEGILDPFQVQVGWFKLDFPSLLIVPGDITDMECKAKVEYTIDRLHLNHDDPFVNSRLEYVLGYCNHCFTFAHLAFMAPFIACEIERQGILDRLSEIMGLTSP